MSPNKKIHQVILLDKKGNVAYSCDSIYKASRFIGKKIINQIPFLESIFHKLVELDASSSTIRFSRLENPLPNVKGAYDFTFSYMPTEDGEFILWSIYDYSFLYENIKNSQQKRHEIEILKETMSNKSQSAGSNDQ